MKQPLKAVFVPKEFANEGQALRINGVGGYTVVEVTEAPTRDYDVLPTMYDVQSDHNASGLDT